LVVKKFGYPRFIHLHVLTFRTGVLAYIIKIMKGIPYVITEHSSYYLPEKGVNRGFIWEFFTRYFSKKSQGITAVSEYLRNAMIKKGFFVNTFEVVRNVVPDYFFRDYIANKNTDKIILSNITCFDDSVKNISGIVKTIGKLKEIRKDFILYLVGDGPDKKKIETMVNTMNLNDFILFTGLLEGEELLKIYQISDFTVLFSYYETMAVVIAESMACGKPVVASGVGGIPELINSSTGLLVRPGDEDDLLNKINLMINDYKNYDSRYIREYAYNLFSEKAIEEQFLRFYSFVINS